MKVTVLIENLVYSQGLKAEHGLSLLIETDSSKRILFDTGQSSAFIDNASSLGADLNNLDGVVISHGHYDHTGGLPTFLEINKRTPVFMKASALQPKYHDKRYIGIPESIIRHRKRLELIQDDASSVLEIIPGIFLVTDTEDIFSEDKNIKGFYMEKEGKKVPDSFRDEQFMVIRENEKLAVFTGCSHLGISNILETVQRNFSEIISAVLGGFHLRGSDMNKIQRTSNYLRTLSPDYVAVNHCTGVDAYHFLKTELEEQSSIEISYAYTGKQLLLK